MVSLNSARLPFPTIPLLIPLRPLGRHGYPGLSAPAPAFPAKFTADPKVHLGNPSQHSSDPVVIHPGASLAMLDLLASVSSEAQPEVLPPHSPRLANVENVGPSQRSVFGGVNLCHHR